MKKTLFVLLFLTVFCFCSFAENVLFFTISPFAGMRFSKTAEEKEVVKADSGFGAAVRYTNRSEKTIQYGADLLINSYKFSEKGKVTAISLLGKAGYFHDLGNSFELFAFGKLGFDYQIHGDAKSKVVQFGLEGGAEYKINEKWTVSASLEGMAGFSKNENAKFMDLKVNPNIGISFKGGQGK